MPLTAGSTLGPYVIEEPLGAGGMGEVYRARDTRLNRTVAVKILSDRLTTEPQYRKRFEREARVVAALEHPHICPLYDVGDEGGTSFLVMQHLQGETLASLLRRGPLPVDRTIRHAVEIAGALDAAHRAGVVHRDLKPANIMVTKSGVKLLDFGLARVIGGDGGPNEALAGATTVSDALTGAAALMGTVPYMAPEQVEGRTVDARTDIFALGAVIFEMATGRRAFEGASQASVIAAIISAEPPAISASRTGVPPGLDRVVKKCLAKDPDARWQDAGDLAAELQWLGEQAVEVSASAAGRRSSTRGWLIATFLAAITAAAAAWVIKPAGASPEVAHLSIDLPPGVRLGRPARPVLALSPDGRQLIFVATVNGQPRLFLREMARPESTALTDIEDGCTSPFFSADGRWVGYQSGDALRKIGLGGGGASAAIASIVCLTGGSWGTDDRIVFAGDIRVPLSSVAASGGKPETVTTIDSAGGESSHRFPELLPGGRAVIFTAGPPRDGAWHEANLVAQSLETGERHTLVQGAAQAHYLAPGYLAYSRGGTLYAVPFDEAALRVTGPAVALVEDVMEDPGHGTAQFVVSANGTLAYLTGGLQTMDVVLADRQGRTTPMIPHERRRFDSPRLSPDRSRLALNVGGGNDATFVYDVAGGMLSRVTSDVNHLAPTWAPDGKKITTRKTLEGEIVSTNIDRSGPEDVLFKSPVAAPTPSAWTADGRTLFFTLDGDIWTLTLPERRAEAVINSRFREAAPAPSPDGRWLAYNSNESDRDEVYVSQFPAGQRWRVSRAGGTEPVWSRDSKWLYFRQGSKLMSVTGRPPFENPVELFDAPWAYNGAAGRAQYDVAPDGEGFIMIRTPDADATRIHVVLNWVEEVKRRIPR